MEEQSAAAELAKQFFAGGMRRRLASNSPDATESNSFGQRRAIETVQKMALNVAMPINNAKSKFSSHLEEYWAD